MSESKKGSLEMFPKDSLELDLTGEKNELIKCPLYFKPPKQI